MATTLKAAKPVLKTPVKASKAAAKFAVSCYSTITETPEELERHRRISVHMGCICLMWFLSAIAALDFLTMVATILPVTIQEIVDYSTNDYRELRPKL